ncbi:hypothetical protein [Dialister succinatiphilus]|uniref:hypothetical protein n=1 Tax=Dialister succinatiphilus TaxID=487173 RepID=UPI004024B077
MFNQKRITGQTSETKEHLLLGAGVFAVGYEPGKDTLDSLKTSKKLIGATTGGGTFTATKNGHYLQIDGVPENTKGNYILDSWATTLQITLQETTVDSIKMGLAAAKLDTTTTTGYTTIIPKNGMEDEDYINSVSFIGRLSGSNDPVVITVFNAFNNANLSLNPKDGQESSIQVTLAGHYTPDDPETPPFKIYYPTLSEG